MSDCGFGDFEFERRFFVDGLPPAVLTEPDPELIVQSYYLAAEGYAMRMRVQSSTVLLPLDGTEDELQVLGDFASEFEFCAITVKGPMNGGTRYEAEREIDVNVGLDMIRLGGKRIIKNRYALWLGGDGWVVDVFGGANRPLIVAECERGGPVTDLSIPSFCVTEVTDDRRFSNESLSHTPFGGWADAFERELATDGPKFLQGFGHNTLESDA
ncbi:CYTH domain-containing protein [Sanguibacter inulinus]|uniref:CYTH domain-containing protein n=1 Tax=Sanguibacter inulinus TaxID=60922 RepID=A0A853EQH0_9MICO|nr:CYTH domain-containing protein [Sanguibacter inulinus]MBF0721710.1 CYTH domain-containing protein [Sanguibacter inulinus]NYS92855.1 CYTH domain-containing protein [Sanguibacter inulinus]